MLDVKLNSEEQAKYDRLVGSLNLAKPAEFAKKSDRYDTFESIRNHPKYKDTYIIYETDKIKGSRIIQINSQNRAIVREDNFRELKDRCLGKITYSDNLNSEELGYFLNRIEEHNQSRLNNQNNKSYKK